MPAKQGYTVTPFGTVTGADRHRCQRQFLARHLHVHRAAPGGRSQRRRRDLSIAGRTQVSVPEPAVVLLFGLGLLAFARLRFRRTQDTHALTAAASASGPV